MNKEMSEVMRYFGLNHRPSSGEKFMTTTLSATYRNLNMYKKFNFIEYNQRAVFLEIATHEC